MPCPFFGQSWAQLPILSFGEYVLWKTMFESHWKSALNRYWFSVDGNITVPDLIARNEVLFRISDKKSDEIAEDLRALFSTWSPSRIFDVCGNMADVRLIMDSIYLKHVQLENKPTIEWFRLLASLRWSEISDDSLEYGTRISSFITPCGKRLCIPSKLYLAGFRANFFIDERGNDMFQCKLSHYD